MASNAGGLWKITNFWPVSLFINGTRYGHSYYGTPIGTRIWSIKWCHFGDLEYTVTQILRTQRSFFDEFSETVRDRDAVTMEYFKDLHMPYSGVSYWMTLSDFGKYSMTWSIVQLLCNSWASCLMCLRLLVIISAWSLQDLEYLDRADKRQLVTALFQAFGARMACSSMLTPSTASLLPSLKQLRSNEKQIMIFFPSSDMEAIRNHIFGGLVWSDEVIRIVVSPKTQTIAELVSMLGTAVASSRAATSSSGDCRGKTLHVLKAVLSPDMSMVFGRYEYRSMRELVTYEASPAVGRWVSGKVGLNVVAVDFVGVGDMVRQLLQLNTSRAWCLWQWQMVMSQPFVW